MAIKKDFYRTREDGVILYRTYSDIGKSIRKVGTDEIYDEAIDTDFFAYDYEECDTPSENEVEETIE